MLGPDHLPKAPAPNAIVSVVRISECEFWGDLKFILLRGVPVTAQTWSLTAFNPAVIGVSVGLSGLRNT